MRKRRASTASTFARRASSSTEASDTSETAPSERSTATARPVGAREPQRTTGELRQRPCPGTVDDPSGLRPAIEDRVEPLTFVDLALDGLTVRERQREHVISRVPRGLHLDE
jgi:hypothetical protein